MSQSSTLPNVVKSMLQQALGEPDRALRRDAHWSLKPGDYKPAINILVDTSEDRPEVWIFDPNSENDGITRMTIEHIEQVMGIIGLVKQRLEQAQAKR